MKRCLLIAALALALMPVLPLSAARPVPTPVPVPASMEIMDGKGLTLTDGLTVTADTAFAAEAALAADMLKKSTGFAVRNVTGTAAKQGIVFRRTAGLPGEGYRLTVKNGCADIEASDPAGAFYGFQTLLQLMPPEIYSGTVRKNIRWQAPAVRIGDAPRFPWRGLMLDDARHFFGIEGFKAMVDSMAAHKMNVIHWHLTDDQGWRIEIKKYPQLTKNGAVRAQSPRPRRRTQGDGKPYGPYFYTQEQIRELVAYAAARHITVVPEIEMPGHVLALLTSFPELSCSKGPFVPRWRWGIERGGGLCAGNDAVFPVLKDILDEVMDLFPGKYIHCGGDEACKNLWDQCPKCRKRIADNNLKNVHGLQSWFLGVVANYLESKGHHLISWFDIMDGGLPKGAAIMSWRGTDIGIQAAKLGHRVVMTPKPHCYLDYGQGLSGDKHEYIGFRVRLENSYAMDPVAGIPAAMQSNVLGLEGTLWSEYMWTPADQQWKAWPRAAALAEVAWSPADKRQWKDFRRRIPDSLRRLDAMGVAHAPLAPEPAAAHTVKAASWKAGDFTTDWTLRSWDITSAAKKAGKYTVTFRFTGGRCRVDINRVLFRVNGKETVADAHAGTTGWHNKGNAYTLTLPSLPKGAKVELLARLRTDGGTDSSGDIFLSRP